MEFGTLVRRARRGDLARTPRHGGHDDGARDSAWDYAPHGLAPSFAVEVSLHDPPVRRSRRICLVSWSLRQIC